MKEWSRALWHVQEGVNLLLRLVEGGVLRVAGDALSGIFQRAGEGRSVRVRGRRHARFLEAVVERRRDLRERVHWHVDLLIARGSLEHARGDTGALDVADTPSHGHLSRPARDMHD